MKINKQFIAPIFCVLIGLTSCQKETDLKVAKNEVSTEVLSKIKALGFSTKDVKMLSTGYLVEGDIMLTDSLLNAKFVSSSLRVGKEEHYRTFNIVGGLPRTITIGITGALPSTYVAALDEAISRYNALGLRLRFRRRLGVLALPGTISIFKADGNAPYLASAFPALDSGNPGPGINVNSDAIGNGPQSYLATILAHEIGHTIGFRHTDYADRSYSCGIGGDEGQSNTGAIYIPGTPVGPEPDSWMLACISPGQDRPFNSNDVTALRFLYQ